MKKNIITILAVIAILFVAATSTNQFTLFPQSENLSLKTSVNPGIRRDSINIVGIDTIVYQYLTQVKSGRMSIVVNLVKITDTLTGSLSLEACNDNTGLSWSRIDGRGKTNDTLVYTTSSLVRKSWEVDADYLKYRVVIRNPHKARFYAYSNSAWKRYYYNGNLNN